ncbi:MAG: citrate/2-methylcitrate synthase, partial [Steroidobacteraceae bacterium]
MAKDTLTITDNRTGKNYELPIEAGGVIRAAGLREIKTGPDDFGLMSYDPAFTNTASCRSRITFIDGDKGILRYRGFPIEDLAEHSNYLEVAYLIVKGELPDAKHYAAWEQNIKTHTMVHENIKKFMEGFRYDAHPMAMLCGSIASLSAFDHEDLDIDDPAQRKLAAIRLIAKMPTIAAACYRYSISWPVRY